MTRSESELWQHAPLLRERARRLCANAADADDLVQDTYVRALRGWCHYVEQGKLRGWLVAILHHLHVDRCRKAARLPRHVDIDAHEIATPEPSDGPVWASLQIDRVLGTLSNIPPAFRVTFELHAQGLSYDEIASELRIPKNTVGTRLIRTRRRIKSLLLASA